MDCPDCGQPIKSARGMALHRQAKHPDEAGEQAGGANLAAVRVTLAELERMGRLEKVDTARVVAVQSIASALDQSPFNSQMWREYREALEGLTSDGSDDGPVEALLAEMSASVGDQTAS